MFSPAVVRGRVVGAAMVLMPLVACSRPDGRATRTADDQESALASTCSSQLRPGSLQVARVDPGEAETGIGFDLIGDGAGPGVQACGDSIYADVNALMTIMGQRDSVIESNGVVLVGRRSTQIPAYWHEGLLYVSVTELAMDRRALLLQRDPHRMDGVLWPQPALLHLKKSGLTQGAAYQAAVREGLIN